MWRKKSKARSIDKPEEKILGILANFEDDGEDQALRNILQDVQASTDGDFAESRYFKQLRILAQLRKLDIKFIEAMETITKYFKEEQDPLYRRGEQKGLKAGEHKKAIEAAIKMKRSGVDVKFISDMLDLSVEEVEKL